jgi:hypothetical protein
MPTTYALAPNAKAQFLDAEGYPVAGGLLYSYASGTTNPLVTYQDQAGTPNTNPIVLDGAGRANLWLGPGAYTLTLKDSTGAQLWSVSNIAAPAQLADIAAALSTATGLTLASLDSNGHVPAAQLPIDLANGIPGLDANKHVLQTELNFNRGGAGAVDRQISAKLADVVHVKDFGAVCDGVADDAAAINAALSSGALVIRGSGLTSKVNSSLTVPAGVTLENISIQAGTAGMNVVLINSYSRLVGVTIRGTGTQQIVERAIYPAANGIIGAYLDRLDISNLTYGVHFQNVTSGGAWPTRCYVNVYVHDLAGKIGNSEGYGVLCSPATLCELHVRASGIPRHALYLSNGAARNKAWVQADSVTNYCVQLFSTASQVETAENEIWIDATNVTNAAGQAGQAWGCGLIQNTNRNRIHVAIDSGGATDGAVQVQGVGATGGPYPTDNVLEVIATGIYTGFAIVNSTDADNTRLINSTLRGHGSGAIVNFGDTGGNVYTPKAAGSVQNCSLDGIDSSTWGVTNNAARGGLLCQFNRIINTAASVKDNSGTRSGFNKSFQKSVAFAGVAAGTTATQTITLPESYTQNVSTQITVVGINILLPGVSAIVSASTATSVTVAFLNGSTQTQNGNIQLFISAD